MMDFERILKEMTLEEKAKLLTGNGLFGVGGNEKFDIPLLQASDGPHGIRRVASHSVSGIERKIEGGEVCYPSASAIGSSWNTDIAYKTGAALARDCREEDIDIILGPGINMKRTPRCGRNFEYYSEDPYLSGMLGAAYVNGAQDNGVGTSVKHFAVNNQETERRRISAEVDERTLREYYLKEFEVMLQNCNPTSIMCAYNKLNGIWCSENKYLLNDVLKDTWNYDGLVVSDWNSVHDICLSLKAGLDLQMPMNKNILEQLKDGLDKGRISEADIDRAVLAVLKFIDRIKSLPKSDKPYNRNEQHQIAYEAASESVTLLKNDNNVLPITPGKYKKIAIIGEPAENPVFMGGGSSYVTVEKSSVDTPLECIRRLAGDDIEIAYVPNYAAKKYELDPFACANLNDAAGDADLVILFACNNLGFESETEAEDRNNLTFLNYISRTIRVMCDLCKNVVVVMQTGSPMIPVQWNDMVQGIVQMWFAGEACGSALADILFGKVNPSGKLSETFILEERTDIDYPGNGRNVCYREGTDVGYRYYDKHPEKVWYPFGYGLSYTEYEYSDMSAEVENTDGEYTITVKMKLKNIGKVAGKEVVQLYVRPMTSIVSRPVKELKKFDKIFLEAGEEKTVEFKLTNRDFEYYNACMREWYLESGKYDILIGASSTDIRLEKSVVLYNDNGYTTDSINRDIIV